VETWSFTLREERRLRVFKNRVLRTIFGTKREKGTGECMELYNEKLNDTYFSARIVRVIKSRRKTQACHVARMGERRGAYRFLVGNLTERDHLEDTDVDGKIILRWIFRKWNGGPLTGLTWLRLGTGGGHLSMR
jgi:prenyltransferase beta subunit